MEKTPKKAAVKINSNAKTGKFVTKNFAKKHPGTTVAETQKRKDTDRH